MLHVRQNNKLEKCSQSDFLGQLSLPLSLGDVYASHFTRHPGEATFRFHPRIPKVKLLCPKGSRAKCIRQQWATSHYNQCFRLANNKQTSPICLAAFKSVLNRDSAHYISKQDRKLLLLFISSLPWNFYFLSALTMPFCKLQTYCIVTILITLFPP